MMQNKYVFGITGGSGTGKSTVSDIFRLLGYDVIDCDKLARKVTEKGEKCLYEIADAFGCDVIFDDGTLDRKRLSHIVFSDSEQLKKLNAITHKYISKKISEHIRKSDSDFIGIDGAVLFESGVSDMCECVVGVLADINLRKSRIIARDNLSESEAEARIASQKSDEFYRKTCKYLIYNNFDEDSLKIAVREVASKLEDEKRKKDFSL